MTEEDAIATELAGLPDERRRSAALAAIEAAIDSVSPSDPDLADQLAGVVQDADAAAKARALADRLDHEYLVVHGRFATEANSVDPVFHDRLFRRARLAAALALVAEREYEQAIYEAYHGAELSPSVMAAARTAIGRAP